MTRTNPRQPLWQRVKEEADYKTLGSAHDRQKLSTLADGARWEHGADAEKLSTYAARHAAAQPAYDAAAARYAADDGADDDRFAELPRIAKDVPRTFGGVDLLVTAERLLLLDTQPLLSPSVMLDLVRRDSPLPADVQSHENLMELHSLRLQLRSQAEGAKRGTWRAYSPTEGLREVGKLFSSMEHPRLPASKRAAAAARRRVASGRRLGGRELDLLELGGELFPLAGFRFFALSAKLSRKDIVAKFSRSFAPEKSQAQLLSRARRKQKKQLKQS